MVTEIGLKIVKGVQSISNGFFDVFFNTVTMFGEEALIILLLVVIYFAVNKRFGEYLGYSIISSMLVNTAIKNTFKASRPFEVDDTIINLRPETSGGFSFPSGHTQSSTTVFASIYNYCKKNYLLVIALVVGSLVALSRLYLGVHFPKDVIVGFALAFLISALTYFLYNKFEKKKITLFVITGLVFTPFLFLAKTNDFITIYALYWGFVLGVFIENKYVNFQDTTNNLNRLLRVLIALVSVLIVYFVLKFVFPDNNIFRFIRYTCVSFVAIGIVPIVIKKLNL